MSLEPPVQQALLDLAVLLAQWAARINLTGHRGPEGVVRRLILDALALSQVLPPWQQLVDIGSGAGFPGLPLALAHPERRVLLVEARERRHHFQRFAVRGLKIGNATPLRGRAEALEPAPSDLVVAQALAAPRRALELALAWAAPGGWIALPGGETPPAPGSLSGDAARDAAADSTSDPAPDSPPDADAGPSLAGREAPSKRLTTSRIVRYRVPCGGPQRTLWLGQRGG